MPSQETIEKLAKVIRDLLPTGAAWENLIDDDLFLALAVEFARVEEAISTLLRDLDPLTAVDLLLDWETLLGLPDECTPDDITDIERQVQARRKLANQGGQSAPYFVGLAEGLGFTDVVVTDRIPFRVGYARVGDPLTNDRFDEFQVGLNTVGERLRGYGWNAYFEVNLPATEVTEFTVGRDTVGERLRTFSNPLLECTIKREKNAGTGVFFTFRTP